MKHESPQVSARPRPVTIIAYLYLLPGLLGTLGVLANCRAEFSWISGSVFETWTEKAVRVVTNLKNLVQCVSWNDGSIGIPYSILGAGILAGRNWARWLTIVLAAGQFVVFHISTAVNGERIHPGFAMLGFGLLWLTVYYLTRPDASAFFYSSTSAALKNHADAKDVDCAG